MSFAYVKNEFVLEEKAVISIKERGFRFGDGVFETIRVHKGILYQLDAHLKRMQIGMDVLKIESKRDIKLLAKELVLKNNVINGILRISISRGTGSIGYLPKCEDSCLVIETSGLANTPKKPISLYLSSWEKPSVRSLPCNSKLMQGLNSTLARMEANDYNCFEALQLNSDKYIAECSSSNIFWFKDNTLYTPDLKCDIVWGVTRDTIMEISPYKIKPGSYNIEELSSADEVFICNSAWHLLSVDKLEPLGFTWNKSTHTAKMQQSLKHHMEHYVAA